jgi:GAF domain-containing protein
MDDDAHILEDERLAALARYDVMNTPSEPSFDRITRITKIALDVPMAGVSLIDGHRQWFKSRQGTLAHETCKSLSFCNIAIRMPEPLVIEDAPVDARFKTTLSWLDRRTFAPMPERTCAPRTATFSARCVRSTPGRDASSQSTSRFSKTSRIWS